MGTTPEEVEDTLPRAGEEPLCRTGSRERRSVVTAPATRSAWLRVLEGVRQPLLTQTPRWLDGLTAMGHRDASRLYSLPGGRELLLPLVARGRGPVAVAASWPHGLGYGGILASDGRVTPEDSALVAADAARHRGLRLSVAPSPWAPCWTAPPTGARAQDHHLTQVLPLPGPRGGAWAGYSTNVRRSVRRAERAGLEVRRDVGGTVLADFDRLYRLSVDRWALAGGKPLALARVHARFAEPPRHLAALAQVLGDAFVTWSAWREGEPVASIVVLHGSDHAFYWRGAMDRALAARTHANALLHHLAIEESQAAGHRFYSFGESDEGSPLAEYKAKFGAAPLRWSTYHFERFPVSATTASARRVVLAAASSAAGVTGRRPDRPVEPAQHGGARRS
ncbi:GNAT family N-acetyltransferase [Kineococcus sp. TBRC 1896]|uniref:GNAT family N-acetyltransferase n=1 Tax=Kineococcus mangrovi TaxID=1660183 RepID=A0ABV4HWX1_9ACTN